MTSLEKDIIEILKTRDLSFEEFMQRALYTPELGYYMKEQPVIGRGGDFYTSSSIEGFFSVLMGIQTEEIWQAMGYPQEFVFLEFGSGTGHFALDMLSYLKNRPIYEALKYIIVELNPHRIRQQRTLLSDHEAVLTWISDIEEAAPFEGIIFSNELLDAFAVSVVVIKDGMPMELWLSLSDGKITECLKPIRPEIRRYILEFCPDMLDGTSYEEGYRTEINLRIKDWLSDCSTHLKRGFIITVDYGYSALDYYSPDRNRGTLLCYYKHSVNEDPYINIGEQDITAHVNFSSLKKWGEELGLKTCGFASQGVFLASLDIERAIKYLYGANPDAFAIARLKTLLVPQGLGESHKVMVQSKGLPEIRLRGFELSNRVRYL